MGQFAVGYFAVGTLRRWDISPLGHFAVGTLRRLGHFAVGYFAVGYFAVGTLRRCDTSPLGHFAVGTLRRSDISPWAISPLGHFAVPICWEISPSFFLDICDISEQSNL